MKRFIFTLIILFGARYATGNDWIHYGPSGITANNVCFNADQQGHTVICSSDGLYVTDVAGANSSYYSYGGLPVWDALGNFSADSFFLVQGNGSFSDGIYSFNTVTQQFTVLEWCYKPHFIVWNPLGFYVAGHQTGLLKSLDGHTWTAIPFFEGKDCKTMTVVPPLFCAVSFSDSSSNHLALSTDGGITWNLSVNAPPLSDIIFDEISGHGYGIFPGISNSSGLWESSDWGMNWNNLFFSDYINAVGTDVMHHIFLGWDHPISNIAGVAFWNPASLTPVPCNNGLTNWHIFKFKINPILSSIKIFCCTGDGVFFMDSSTVGLNQDERNESGSLLFPNPAREMCYLLLNEKTGLLGKLSISIINPQGKLIRKLIENLIVANNPIVLPDLSFLSPGFYFIKLEGDEYTGTFKFVKE
ncbi:MAG: T9SS type A sorting domain-containing protein [Bacteroidetes bacterium]|nr:T9SS type A sorting domain-containing protein [Bacteroidota bacterium]